MKFTSERVKTHGMSNTRVYSIWEKVIARGTGKCEPYVNKFYFDKGVRVCERWLKFENFYADMGEPPPNHSIDRIDFNGNYEPSNCRWADNLTQANNRSSNHFLEIDGIKKSIAEWARETGVKPNTIIYRLIRGWDAKKAITNEKFITKASENKLKRIRNCLTCGKQFIPRTSQLKAGVGKHCSQKCNKKTKAIKN